MTENRQFDSASSFLEPPRSRKRFRKRLAAVGVLTLALSACSSALPEPEPERAPAVPAPVLTETQLAAILDDIDEQIEQGDASLSADELGVRIAGMAREVRASQYVIEAADPARVATELPREKTRLIVPATNDWPRDIVVITEPPADSQIPRVLVLNQQSARDNYELVQWSKLLPGVSFPAMPLPEQGAQYLADDAEGFVLSPREVAEAFTDVLSGKKEDDDDSRAGLFGEDLLAEMIQKEFKSLKDGVAAVGSVKKSFEPAETPAVAFEALQGGAIVVTSIREVTTFEVESGSLNVSSDAAMLLDNPSVNSELKTIHDISLVFYVPTSDAGGEVQILGETRDMVSATGK